VYTSIRGVLVYLCRPRRWCCW